MKKIILSVFCVMTTISVSAQGYSNPILKGMHPDPSIVRVGQDYYLVNSSFNYFPGVPIFHSRDLIHWKQIGNILDRRSQLELKNLNQWLGIYAPCIRYNDGLFYMVVTLVPKEGQIIVHTDDPAGKWSDPVIVKQGGIDPDLFFENGRCYLTTTENGISTSEINPLTGEKYTAVKQIWTGTGRRYTEGPHIFKKDGYYFLFAAEGGTEYAHGESVARSKNIYGPYEAFTGNQILTHCNAIGETNQIQGTGHADFVQADDGSWWMVCLAFRTQGGSYHNCGRETFLAPVEWAEGGWPVVNNNGTISLRMDTKTLQQTAPSDTICRDDFESPAPSPIYRTVCSPVEQNYNYNDIRPGWWRLKASTNTIDSNEEPTMITRIQEDPFFRAGTAIDFSGLEPGAEAGLTILMTCDSHYDLNVVNKGGNYFLQLIYRLSQIRHKAAEVALKGYKVYLQISGDDNNYHFSYSEDNINIINLGDMSGKYLSTEVAGGFTGAVIGMYVQSEQDDGSFADFDCFDYIRTR